MRRSIGLTSLCLAAFAAAAAAPGCTYHQHYELTDSDASAADDQTTTLQPPDGGAVDTCSAPDDPHNCGACGHDCLGGACVEGACQPVVLASGEEVSYFVLGGGHGYWINEKGEIRTVPVAGGTPSTIATGFSTQYEAQGFSAADATHVYFATSPSDAAATGVTSRVVRIAKAGHSVEIVGAASDTPSHRVGQGAAGLLVHDGTVHWIGRGERTADVGGELKTGLASTLYACPVSGCKGAPTALRSWTNHYSGPDFEVVHGIALAASGQLLVSNWRGRVESIDPKGSDDDKPLSVRNPEAPVADRAFVFFSADLGGPSSQRALMRCTMSPAPKTAAQFEICTSLGVIASGPDVNVLSRPVLDDGHVYWSTRTNAEASVMRCAKDGDGCGERPEKLFIQKDASDSVNRAYKLAVDEKAIYWVAHRSVLKLAKPAPTTPRATH